MPTMEISVKGAHMGNLLRAYSNMSLIKRIVVGLIIGAALALLIPQNGPGWLTGIGGFISLLGTLFVSALRAVAPILVFFLVISALMNAKAAGNMKSVIALYAISTLIAAIVAVIASFMFPIELTLTMNEGVQQDSPSGVGEVMSSIVLSVVANQVKALSEANFLGILAWAIVLGIALRKANGSVKDVFSAVSDAVSTIVRWVINLAPFGVMGLVYTSVSESGMDIFVEYGQLILLLVSVMIVIALVTNPIIVFVCTKRNPYPLVLRCLKDSGITAFFTRSSAANIPINLELCRKLGLNKDNYSVSIPLGATINMAGAAVTISVMTMAAVHTVGIDVEPVTALVLCVLAAISACGASGVAGGSLLLIPLACSLFGIDPAIATEVVAIGFIISVVQDSCETALNSSSDVLFTATAEYAKMRRDGKEYHLGKDAYSLDELD